MSDTDQIQLERLYFLRDLTYAFHISDEPNYFSGKFRKKVIMNIYTDESNLNMCELNFAEYKFIGDDINIEKKLSFTKRNIIFFKSRKTRYFRSLCCCY